MKYKAEIESAIGWYEIGCRKIAEAFRNKYFTPDTELFFVGNDVTGVAMLADYYFGVNDMYEYLKHKYTKEKMFMRYDNELEHIERCGTREDFPNIRNWNKMELHE